MVHMPGILEFKKWKHSKYVLSQRGLYGKHPVFRKVISHPETKSVKVVYFLTKFLPFLPLCFTKC